MKKVLVVNQFHQQYRTTLVIHKQHNLTELIHLFSLITYDHQEHITTNMRGSRKSILSFYGTSIHGRIYENIVYIHQ